MEMLSLGLGDVTLQIAPRRGAIITSLRVRGKELLYLDRGSFEDMTKNVRGGVPILFPFAGKLNDGRLTLSSTEMKQHGFGRNRPWTVVEKREDRVRLLLEQDDETRAQFPYEMRVEYTVSLFGNGARAELMITNTGEKPLPLSPGWHPYFACPAAKKANVSGNVPGFTADKLGNDREFDFGLPAPSNGRTQFEIPELGAVRIDFSPRMAHTQFWSLPGRDFICLEPFYGPNDTINTERRLNVAPGRSQDFWVEIALD